jgi:hypothetical protein
MTPAPPICLSTVLMAQCNEVFIEFIESCILKMLLMSVRCPAIPRQHNALNGCVCVRAHACVHMYILPALHRPAASEQYRRKAEGDLGDNTPFPSSLDRIIASSLPPAYVSSVLKLTLKPLIHEAQTLHRNPQGRTSNFAGSASNRIE